MKRVIIALLAMFIASTSVYAGGFFVGEMAARSAGMASAFTAVSDDASAAWHNPAGVMFLEGNQLMLGGDVILTKNSFTTNTSNPLNPASADAANGTFFVPHAYMTYKPEDSRVGFSLGINSPFGLETDWPSTAPFGNANTFSRINMVMLNPSVAYQVSDNLSIAVGIDYANAFKVELNNNLQDLSGNGDGVGANASLLYKGDGFSFGVNYRSRIKVKLAGNAIAKSTLALVGGTTSTANTSVTFPDQVNVGLAFAPNDQWMLSADVDWVNWKSFDAINVTYSSAAYRTAVSTLQGLVGSPVTGSTTIPENWKATVAFRLGAEWKYNDRMRVRFGFIYDPTPINAVDFSPAIPGNDRQLYTIGYGYDLTPATTLDLGYAYVHINNRNQTQSPTTPPGAPGTVKNGTYKGNAHILMASLNYLY